MRRPRRTSRLVFEDRLPDLGAPRETLVIHDERLPALSSALARWLGRFPLVYPVRAGEALKTLPAFGRLAEWAATTLPPTARGRLRVVGVGGGSVGDFAGFFASVWRRGVGLVLVPTTWLAAVDSAHGGKTALNAGGAKNAIGTFHPACEVHLVRRILDVQGEDRAREAWGEFAKVAILDGGPWTRSMRRDTLPDRELLWKYLAPAVRSKLRIVARDPEEQSGTRRLLNLGHTTAHVLEAFRGVSHGVAVANGVAFAVAWSERRRILPARTADDLREFLATRLGSTVGGLPAGVRPIPRAAAERLLSRDKKAVSASHVAEVFLEGWGKPRIDEVRFADLLAEMVRQRWVRS